MNPRILELWGETLLEAARFSKGSKAFFDLFQNGYATNSPKADSKYEQFVQLCQKSFGKDGIEAFNSTMKEFYENIGVVPRAQYNELNEKYLELRDKVRELEEIIEDLRIRLKSNTHTPLDLMNQWNEAAEKYADINQKFFMEFSKFFLNSKNGGS